MSYTNSQIVTAALEGKDASTPNGNMSTRHVNLNRWAWDTGHMPKAWAHLFKGRVRKGAVSQIIYSYATPIAWKDSVHGWIIPQVSYSTTTSSKHQTHLYRLRGRHITLAWDATAEDAQRVLDGIMIFTTDTRGKVNGIKAA